jgi:carboxylesterase
MMKMVKKIGKWLGIFLLLLLLVILVMGLAPVSNDGYASRPDPLSDFDAAVRKIETIQEDEIPITNETSRSIFLNTGAKKDDVYVLIHGLTNAPEEFAELGQLLFEQGHNVLILRMPYHGLKGLEITELDPLTAEDIRGYADQVIDIAAALGENVTVIGISGGGAATAWIAQNRPEVERAILLSPFFGIAQTPKFLDPIVMNALLRLPPLSNSREPRPDRHWLYRGESGKGVAAFMSLGQSVIDEAQEKPPAVGEILILTSASDLAVDNDWAIQLADQWRAQGAEVETYEFDRSLDIPHASIDPFTEAPKRQLVYEQIFAWLDQQEQ